MPIGGVLPVFTVASRTGIRAPGRALQGHARGACWKEMTNKIATHLTKRIAAAMAFSAPEEESEV